MSSIFQKLGLTTPDPEAPAVPAKPVEEIEDAPVAAKNPKRQAGSKRPSADVVEEEESDTSADTALSDKEIVKSLRKAVEQNEADGFDFVKFTRFLKKNANLEESTRYTTAISAAEAMSVTPTDLISSGQDALKVLSAASKKFDADLAEIEEQTEESKKELAEVEAQIESLNNRQKALNKKIQNGTATVENQRKSFDASLEIVSSEVKEVISNIKKYSK